MLVSGLTAAALLAGSGGWSAAALPRPPAQPRPVLAEEAGKAEAAPELIIAAQDPVLDPEAENYAFSVLIRNPTEEALPAGRLQLRLGIGRLTDEEALTILLRGTGDGQGSTGDTTAGDEPSNDFVLGDSVAGRGMLITEVQAPETAAESERTVAVRVPRSAVPLGDLSEAGVYPVRAELIDPVDEGDSAADGTDESASDATGTGEGSTGTDGDSADSADPAQSEGNDANGTGTGTDADADGSDPAPPEGNAEPQAPEPRLTGTGTIVWRGANDGARLALTVVVPLVLPGSIDGMPSTGELADAVPRFAQLLGAAERWRATVAVDPRVVAGVRAYGDAAPAAARNLVEDLETATVPVFMLQFADADPAAQSALGLTELLRPTGLSHITRAGSFPEPESAQTGAATAPAHPALDELLDWPHGEPTAWPAAGATTAKTLALLDGAGIGSIILESGDVLGADAAARAAIGEFEALIADAALDGAARRTIAAATEPERASATAELAARLALAAESADRTGMVLALDRGTIADAATPAEVFNTLDALSWVTPTAAMLQDQAEARLRPAEPNEQRSDQLTAAMERSDRIDALAPLLDEPRYLTEYQRVRLLGAFGTRYAQPGAASEAFATRFAERDAELLGGVQVVPSETTQLIGTSSRVPVHVHNALPFDAVVTLKVNPTSAAIRVPELRFEGEAVPAGANATVLVPIDSRVSSGDAWLSVRIADTVDEATFSQEQLHLTIRSSYEAILLTVLGVLAALLFGFGIWRSLRRHRLVGPAPGAQE